MELDTEIWFLRCMELDTEIWFLQIYKRKRVSAFIIDDTVVQIGNRHYWLWICNEPIHRTITENLHFRRKKHVCSRKFP